MKKILISTDFSANSKAALRFAIQLSQQQDFELTFFHSYFIHKPKTYTQAEFAEYEKVETVKIQKQLERFANSAYKKAGIDISKIKCIIKESVSTYSNILSYAKENKFDFICVGTHGAGNLEKILGTNTSNLITHSAIPIIAVPKGYRSHPVSTVLYASDLKNLDEELAKVVAFAKPISAKVEVLHFSYPAQIISDLESLEEKTKTFNDYPVKTHVKDFSFLKNLVLNLQSEVKKYKPSVLIMFTDQKRSLFQKLFVSSNSAEFAFNTTIPLIIYSKS